MKNSKRTAMLILGVVLLMFIYLDMKGQNNEDEIMYRAYIQKELSIEPWTKAVEIRKRNWISDKKNQVLQVQLAVAEFGLLNTATRMKNEKIFNKYYDDISENIEVMSDENKQNGELKAVLSGVYGLKMSFSSFQAMFLGPKSGTLIEEAKEINPSSPIVTGFYANSKFFTPGMWGGSLEKAIVSYEKCIGLYEKDPSSLPNNWLYLEAQLLLGQAYRKNNQPEKAVTTYKKMLDIEPDFQLIKEVLLPKALAKVNVKK